MPYNQKYESNLLRGIEEPRPWFFLEEIRKHIKKSDILLDIGCGTAFKSIQLADGVNKVYGLEPNKKMRIKARENIRKAEVSNFFLINGRAEKIPFNDNYFDIVTCMVAPHSTSEVYRVLKPNGLAILEKIGDRDKWNFKREFNFDEIGPRGQLASCSSGERIRFYKKEFGKFFSKVSIQNGFWKTYYSMDGLLLLLKQTPTIRNFNSKNDGEALQRIQKKYLTAKGLATRQNRILIIARK